MTNVLRNESILSYPDFIELFILICDASNVAVASLLSQGAIGKDQYHTQVEQAL